MIKEIHIIDSENDLIMELRELFEEEKAFRFRNIKPENLDIALKSIPSIIIINEDTIKVDILKICQKIRENEDNSITPIIVISSNNLEEHKIDILKESVEYVISSDQSKEYI